jgi:hypothetical protein
MIKPYLLKDIQEMNILFFHLDGPVLSMKYAKSAQFAETAERV